MKSGLSKTAENLRDEVDDDYRDALEILAQAAQHEESVTEADYEDALETVKKHQEDYDV